LSIENSKVSAAPRWIGSSQHKRLGSGHGSNRSSAGHRQVTSVEPSSRDEAQPTDLESRFEAVPQMLLLKPNCECCDRDLPADSVEARICSFECTFCAPCARQILQDRCPNCGGELVARPRRPAEKLARYPASSERVTRPGACKQSPGPD
jgi:uncharacterized protein